MDFPITILHGDCLDLMKTLADGSVDIVVTSPPYNQIGARINGRKSGQLGQFEGNGWVRKVGEVGYADDMPEPAYQEWLRHVVGECLRVSKGLVWVNHKIRYRDGEAIHPARFLPFPIWSEVVWARGGSMALNSKRFAPSHECLWGFGRPHWWDDHSNRLMSVWNIAPVQNRSDHPCPFPVELAARLILASCPPNGTTLDPFTGSGSTLEACVKTGRRGIGMELDARYIPVIEGRVAEAKSPLFDAISRASQSELAWN